MPRLFENRRSRLGVVALFLLAFTNLCPALQARQESTGDLPMIDLPASEPPNVSSESLTLSSDLTSNSGFMIAPNMFSESDRAQHGQLNFNDFPKNFM